MNAGGEGFEELDAETLRDTQGGRGDPGFHRHGHGHVHVNVSIHESSSTRIDIRVHGSRRHHFFT